MLDTYPQSNKQRGRQLDAETVLKIYTELTNAGASIWLDGGWGIDALLGEQSRPHDDVDLILQQADLERACNRLAGLGYADVPVADTRPWNFVLGDEAGLRIDMHVIVIDQNGDGIYGPVENGQKYPASSLGTFGTILGTRVRCLSPQYQLESHLGYAIRSKDVQDVCRLCEKFTLQLPDAYSGGSNLIELPDR